MSLSLPNYFKYAIQISLSAQEGFNFKNLLPKDTGRYPRILFYRRLALAMAKSDTGAPAATAAQLNLYASLLDIYRYLIDELAAGADLNLLADALAKSGLTVFDQQTIDSFNAFSTLFPPAFEFTVVREEEKRHIFLRELLLLDLASKNRALNPLRILLDDNQLRSISPYKKVVYALQHSLAKAPLLPLIDITLVEALYAPLTADPESLAGQLDYIRKEWAELLPPELLEDLLTAFDILDEEERQWSDGGTGPSEVLVFGSSHLDSQKAVSKTIYHGAGHYAGYDQPEYEAFSSDADWMSNLVMMAKMTHVWLDQLSKSYAYPVSRLDQVPDAELDRLARWGFTGLWLIGIWERSPASRRIKELCGNPDAHASAYSLYDYTIAADLGGEEAFLNLKSRAWKRGIRLASDMVPNHTGIYSRWLLEHPDWFIQSDYVPFPTYRFNGEDLSHDPSLTIQIEDGYWNKQDAAVVFRMIDRRESRTRYIYHGNDGTSIPWNDTAQLNYLIPEVREAVIQTILHVARLTPIIRFDAAMTLAKKHYQRLWFPQRGLGGGIPSRAEHAMGRDEFDAMFPVEFWREVVDRMAQEAPDTLLLAEAFWMMEGYFVRTLGMHRVYNSAFMNMLKMEENAKYRQTIRNVLEFNPEILKRFVNFMNNPDEKTAIEQFGSQAKYFGACVLLVTMPGLPMFGHGQVEGFHEKYGMEYRRAYWNELVDEGLVRGHELWIFPLLKRRWLFSGSENFALYDFYCHDGSIDENVFAYSNRSGDQRTLVLYNNSFSKTAGWIKTALPVAVKTGEDSFELRSTDLCQALSIPDAPSSFLVFRDLSTGLEFLRDPMDMQTRGLFAELSEYEFHVFLDFRILKETESGDWRKLCNSLAGRGVDSVDDELIQLRNEPIISAFTSFMAETGSFGAETGLFEKMLRIYSGKIPLKGIKLETIKLQGALAAAFSPQIAGKSLRLLRESGVSRQELSLEPENRRCALAILSTRWMVLPLGDEALELYGLGRAVSSFISKDEVKSRQEQLDKTELCAAAGIAWKICSERLTPNPISAVFSNKLIQRFMLVHDDRGTTWFNKERFEELIHWLALLIAFEKAQKPEISLLPMLELKELAGASGYRVRGFEQLTEGLFC